MCNIITYSGFSNSAFMVCECHYFHIITLIWFCPYAYYTSGTSGTSGTYIRLVRMIRICLAVYMYSYLKVKNRYVLIVYHYFLVLCMVPYVKYSQTFMLTGLPYSLQILDDSMQFVNAGVMSIAVACKPGRKFYASDSNFVYVVAIDEDEKTIEFGEFKNSMCPYAPSRKLYSTISDEKMFEVISENIASKFISFKSGVKLIAYLNALTTIKEVNDNSSSGALYDVIMQLTSSGIKLDELYGKTVNTPETRTYQNFWIRYNGNIFRYNDIENKSYIEVRDTEHALKLHYGDDVRTAKIGEHENEIVVALRKYDDKTKLPRYGFRIIDATRETYGTQMECGMCADAALILYIDGLLDEDQYLWMSADKIDDTVSCLAYANPKNVYAYELFNELTLKLASKTQ